MFAALTLTAFAALAMAKPMTSEVPHVFKRISSGCGTSGAASCSSSKEGSCCFEAPGGLLLQTQFWDTDPSVSAFLRLLENGDLIIPYSENCDSSRDYTSISTLLSDHGASSTLSYMQKYWLNDDGTSEELWEHEWATHGTCYSTLEPSCFGDNYYKGEEAVAFYETVVKLFKTLPTYEWLAASGITPSDSKTYKWSAVEAALLKNGNGMKPAVTCSSGKISAISWYFNVKGSLVDGDFVAIGESMRLVATREPC
ncbi:hypothetical protein HWV62_44939 [Athelia sp. TMB]|nr:hypothetical protein HWV62_44939 [Athelia sp. TMB]